MRRVLLRAYAELNDLLDVQRRQRSFELAVAGDRVRAVLETLAVPPTVVDAVLVNGRPADLDTPLEDGDRVALYPVFEALDVAGVQRLRARPLRAPRFSVPPELRLVAIRLRLLGFDATCGEPQPANARPGRRIALLPPSGTPGTDATHAIRLAPGGARTAIRELLARLHLEALVARGTRCPKCNAPLEAEPRCATCGRRRPPAPRAR